MTSGLIRLHDALTSASVPALCGAAHDGASVRDHVGLGLEAVKAVHVVGLGPALPACRIVFAILEDEMRCQRGREELPYMGFWPRDDGP
jgi:hypothetical protein